MIIPLYKNLTDTQYKINNLRKIFAIFDVPESELVFYLKDEDNSETVAGNRYEIRKKYWEYTLPQLKNAFSENGLFGNVNPVTSNWIAGFVGIPGIHIDCVANFDESRVELYLGMASKEKNKELFGFLFARKDIGCDDSVVVNSDHIKRPIFFGIQSYDTR